MFESIPLPNDEPYDLGKGSVFLVSTKDGHARLKQLDNPALAWLAARRQSQTGSADIVDERERLTLRPSGLCVGWLRQVSLVVGVATTGDATDFIEQMFYDDPGA